MRALKIVGKILGAILAVYLVLYAIRFQTTLPIEGVVVDAKTGKPVSKVLVRAYWHFSQANPVDTTGAVKGFGTVTDENGRFRIPRKNVTIVLGYFDLQEILLKHPLYDFAQVQVYSQLKKGYQAGTVEGRTLRMTIPFTSLADRYSRPEDNDKLARVIDDCGPEFYVAMRDAYNTRYDLGLIIRELERLATRFPEQDPKHNAVFVAFEDHAYRMRAFQEKY